MRSTVRPLRTNSWRGWMAQPLDRCFAIVHWRSPAPDEARPDPPIYLFDARSNTARPLDGVQRGSVWRGPDILWSDDRQRFALSWIAGSTYLIETDTLRTLKLPDVTVAPLGALIDWSPDGSRLLVRSIPRSRSSMNADSPPSPISTTSLTTTAAGRWANR